MSAVSILCGILLIKVAFAGLFRAFEGGHRIVKLACWTVFWGAIATLLVGCGDGGPSTTPNAATSDLGAMKAQKAFEVSEFYSPTGSDPCGLLFDSDNTDVHTEIVEVFENVSGNGDITKFNPTYVRPTWTRGASPFEMSDLQLSELNKPIAGTLTTTWTFEMKHKPSGKSVVATYRRYPKKEGYDLYPTPAASYLSFEWEGKTCEYALTMIFR